MNGVAIGFDDDVGLRGRMPVITSTPQDVPGETSPATSPPACIFGNHDALGRDVRAW